VYSEKAPDDGKRNCPKHVEFHSKNKFEKMVHLVGFNIQKWDEYVYFNFMRFVYFKYLCTFQYFSKICTISMELSIIDVFTMVREQLEQSWISLYTENIRFKLLFCYRLGFSY
jgi:hypothetical protein